VSNSEGSETAISRGKRMNLTSVSCRAVVGDYSKYTGVFFLHVSFKLCGGYIAVLRNGGVRLSVLKMALVNACVGYCTSFKECLPLAGYRRRV
jgi:hypothetical protein